MKKKVVPYQNDRSSKKEQVTHMFDGISKQYDFLNRVISLGIDIKWRKRVVAMMKKDQPQRLMDIATGTGDSENLDYPDDYFDGITVAFGVRNFEHLEKGLGEILRVLKPKGRLIVLETAVPTKFPFKQGYQLYSKTILPLMGRLFTKDQATYQYLSDSAAVFPHGKAFNNILAKIGFIEVSNHPQTLGVASIYSAKKP